MYTSICRKLTKCRSEKIYGQPALLKEHGYLAGKIVYLQEKKTICDQLIKLIKSVQSVSKFVSFECACFIWVSVSLGITIKAPGKPKPWVYIRCTFLKEDNICGERDVKPSESAVTLRLATLDQEVTHLLVKFKWVLVVINWPRPTEFTISLNWSCLALQRIN